MPIDRTPKLNVLGAHNLVSLLRMLELLYIAHELVNLLNFSWISEGNERDHLKIVSSKKLNLKE
jgi:hypothetical protein